MLEKVLIFKKSIIFSLKKLRILNKSTIFVSRKGDKNYGKDKTIQDRLLRLRLGFMGDCNGQQGSWIWQKQNCST